MTKKPETIDEYLATVREPRLSALQALRAQLHALVPEAEEVISYSIPAFRVEGGIVAGFSATTRGCSYFPFSGSTLATLAEAVRGYSQTKSALHFTPDEPIPRPLLRKLLKARLAELEGPKARGKRTPKKR